MHGGAQSIFDNVITHALIRLNERKFNFSAFKWFARIPPGQHVLAADSAINTTIRLIYGPPLGPSFNLPTNEPG